MDVHVMLDGRETTVILPVHQDITGKIANRHVHVHLVLLVPVIMLMEIVIVNQVLLDLYVKKVDKVKDMTKSNHSF